VPRPDRLWTFEFAALTGIAMLAFCNISIFYSFHNYLARLGMPVGVRGILIGLEPLTAFLLRPILAPMLTAGNGVRWMQAGLIAVALALLAYPMATSIPTIALVRLLHGAGFVTLVSATAALLVHFIPKERSAQGFGVFSVAAQLPYALMPLLVEALLPWAGSEARVYAAASILALPPFGLLAVLRRRLAAGLHGNPLARAARPTLAELLENLRHPDVVGFLTTNLLLFLAHTTVFFFMKEFCLTIQGGDVGLFFTISSTVIIAVRLVGGGLLDRIRKRASLVAFMGGLALGFLCLSRLASPHFLYPLAAWYGLCVGVIMPLLNASMFLSSRPDLRGLNSNLMLFMMDAGFFLAPVMGGAVLAMGHSVATLFLGCAGLCLASVGVLFRLMRLETAVPAARGETRGGGER
jgi:MFS family permease